MHQLILLRHAKAARGSVETADHNRPLTPEGKRTASAMGAMMRRLGLTPDVILVSSSLRTQETLDALAPWDDWPNIETVSSLYMASHMQIRDMLRELPETLRSVLIIGHNPGIQELVQWLAKNAPFSPSPGTAGPANPELARLAEDYPTAALSEFMISGLWHKLGPANATLKRFIQPSDLPG